MAATIDYMVRNDYTVIMEADATGRHEDRRRARTRGALLSAAQALFADRSVDGVSVDDIVERAEVAKGSFYNHFADKEDLAREIARLVRLEVEEQVTAANAEFDDPVTRLARAVCVFIRFALVAPERARVLLRLNSGATLASAPSNAGLSNDLKRGLAHRRFAGISVAAAVPFVMGACMTAMSLALEPARPKHFKAEVDMLVRALLRGLGVSPRIADATAKVALEDIFTERNE